MTKVSRRTFCIGSSAAALGFTATTPSVHAKTVEPLISNEAWLDDVAWVKANAPEGHYSTVRIALPNTFSDFREKSKVFTFFDSIIPVSNSKLFHQMIYGKRGTYGVMPAVSEDNISGLTERYSTLDCNRAQCAVNVLDGGSQTERRTSAWIIMWSEKTIFGITPDGLPPRGRCGLVTLDWRYCCRVANVGISTDLPVALSKAMLRLPLAHKTQTVIYLNRELKNRLGVETFRGVRIREVPLRWDEEVVT